ncbi:putative beta-galactosidase A [Thozetella sp. PMI_491]|nr:putative beta-galactosidase A [Thozetella sp. PMI_491]
MVSLRCLIATLLALHGADVSALRLGGRDMQVIDPGKRTALQDLVTWDDRSLFVHGERIMFYSGEFHPWRLPVPGLWLDVFQKIKALGYTGVSFYVDWALLEGNPGHFVADGVFGFEEFFRAAAQSGIYLLARPGPYINAEVAGGGFPGWLARDACLLRTNATCYESATDTYVANIGKIIADAQITNGGPVILFQAENEYTYGASWVKWPDVGYIEYVNEQYRRAGIVVPFVNNEAAAIGLFTPGKPGGPDIYGHDNYPIGWDCANPSVWSAGSLPTDFRTLHLQQSPGTPYAIPEFQGGAIDSWGGVGLDNCASLVNYEAERVFYKNAFSFGVAIFNVYMTYGGTNWGNLGQSGGYTSYDYGAAIRENRMIDREKYAEAKLEAQFITSSPAYLEATPGNRTSTSFVSTSEITTTPLFAKSTVFYITRHSAAESLNSTPYKLTVNTSIGDITIPQLGGTLTLNGRDSKIHLTDYDVGGYNLIYSSADVYTQSATGAKRVLILYGGVGETHELAFSSKLGEPVVEGGIEGAPVKIETIGSAIVIQWEVTPTRKILHYGDHLDVYLLWRNEAYNYWKLQLEAPAPVNNYTSSAKGSVIIKAGYLMRTAVRSGTALYLTGDLNATTELEVIAGLPGSNNIYFNGKKVPGVKSAYGRLSATLEYSTPPLEIPKLGALQWRYLDSLPEIQSSYDDSLWTIADRNTTSSTYFDNYGVPFTLLTPTSLVASDYGYTTGSLVYRGYFTARGNEDDLSLWTMGGAAFGQSIWINSTFVGSYEGNGQARDHNQTLPLPPLVPGAIYVVTVVIDHMGQETNWTPGYNTMQMPRGIVNYTLSGHPQSDVRWKLTGNLGGEQYRDLARGPLNEGAMYAERQGFHLPSPPALDWELRAPMEGILAAGLGFFSTNFTLKVPTGFDVPMSFVFANKTENGRIPAKYRVQLFVNGYQFGKYINHLGPQTRFPVPQGILNYSGTNYIALTLWALEKDGARLGGLVLEIDAIIASGMDSPALSPQPAWTKREGAY